MSNEIPTPADPKEGYPEYPASDDIYERAKEVRSLNLDTSLPLPLADNTVEAGAWNEKTFEEDETGDDLDIPGSELDEDGEERPGEEDEENEYYSLGGDDHDDLDEE